MSARSYIEVIADGTVRGTRIFLVIIDDQGQEARFLIPGVRGVSWQHRSPEDRPTISLDLANVHMQTRAHIETRSTSVEDLLAEIAASQIASAGEDDPVRFNTSGNDMVDSVAYGMGAAWNQKAAMAQPKPPGKLDADIERIHRLFRDDGSGKNKP